MSATIGDMQTTTTSGPAGTQPPYHPRDVVAGLVNDGLAAHVAGAAVREAVHRGARVRFVQVLPTGLSTEDRSEMDVAMFGVALRAMHKQRRVPCTFETVEGDAALTLVERSSGAAVLVVGRDRPGAVVRVGQYCQEHASCDVLTISGPGSQLEPAGVTKVNNAVTTMTNPSEPAAAAAAS
jgi:hypothetical protein